MDMGADEIRKRPLQHCQAYNPTIIGHEKQKMRGLRALEDSLKRASGQI